MTEEYKPVPEDIKRYRAVALAQEYMKEENEGGLEKAILALLKDGIGVKTDDDAKDLKDSLNPNFIKNFDYKYKKALESITLRDFRGLYDGLFKEYFTGEDLEKANELFDSDETYGSFMKKYAALAEKAKSPTDNFSKEEKESAKKQIMALNRIAIPLQDFEKTEINKMRAPIEKTSLKERIKDAYNPKQEEKKEE
jgi:hypothetical protein